MVSRAVIIGLVVLFSWNWMPVISHADNAEVLPKGVSNVRVNTKIYSTIDERYDPEGDKEKIYDDYNLTLDSGVFPALSLVEQFFGMPAGTGNVGDSDVMFEWDVTTVDFYFLHGLTDRLTLGIKIPYWDAKNNVSAELETTNATVGKNAALNTLAPLGFPGTVPLTTEDVQNLLGDGLDINGDGNITVQGYGYERIQTWSRSDITDIEVGCRYQYLKKKNWRLAFTGGVRLPTGKQDNPDNLMDRGFGTGAWALLFQFQNDYTGIENLVLNGTVRYDLILPNDETLRIPPSPDLPITRNKEEVDRDLGDEVELEVSGVYSLTEAFSAGLLYRYSFKFKDDVSGNMGFDYSSLEEETNWKEHQYRVSLAYTTIPLVKAKKFPVPMDARVTYRNRFAGKNNIFASEYIGFELSVFF
jgi:hypothetical protein